MTQKIIRTGGLGAVALVFALLSACNKQTEVQPVAAAAPAAPAPAAAPEPTATVPAQPDAVAAEDDYVYYPEYEVYYSSRRHDFRYHEGNVWVSRPAPPRVSAQIVLASPSVRLDFHDAPEHHHAEIIRSYPRNWAPPGRGHDDHRDDHKDDRREKR